MIEFLIEYWYLYILVSLAGVGSSFWLGRLNRARIARDAKRDRIEELEKESKEKDEAVGEQMRQIQDLEAKLKGLQDEAARLGESAAGADELYDALSKELD